MGKAELEASLNTLDIALIVFAIFAAFGALGTSWAGFLHWRRSNQLQSLQETENLKLRDTIAAAQGAAATATERAAKLGVTVVNLDLFVKHQQEHADAAVSALQDSQSKLDAAISQANERLAPRRISDEQSAQIVERIRPAGGPLYSGMLTAGPADAQSLWYQINACLEAAGWHRASTPQFLGTANNTATVAYGFNEGVNVNAPYVIDGDPNSGASPAIDAAAYSLVQALNSVGIAAGFFRETSKPDTGPRGIIVKIGTKPF